MKQYEKEELFNLTNENFANLFNVYKRDSEWTYNINKNVYFSDLSKMAPGNFTYYIIKEKDHWSTISFKAYGTIELWWLICKVNNIVDPVSNSPVEGRELKILNNDLANEILSSIKKI